MALTLITIISVSIIPANDRNDVGPIKIGDSASKTGRKDLDELFLF